MLRGLYDKVIDLSASRHALPALAGISFAESSFFPVPPDVLLVPMALARPEKARLYAFVCTIASVLGGLVGYAIGALLYDTLGKRLISIYGYGDGIEAFRHAPTNGAEARAFALPSVKIKILARTLVWNANAFCRRSMACA